MTSRNGHVRCLLLQIEFGANFTARRQGCIDHAALYAVDGNSLNCLSLLLQEGATEDINMANDFGGITLLQRAQQLGHTKIASFLLAHGAIDTGDDRKGYAEESVSVISKAKEEKKGIRADLKLVRHCDYPECDREVAV